MAGWDGRAVTGDADDFAPAFAVTVFGFTVGKDGRLLALGGGRRDAAAEFDKREGIAGARGAP